MESTVVALNSKDNGLKPIVCITYNNIFGNDTGFLVEPWKENADSDLIDYL